MTVPKQKSFKHFQLNAEVTAAKFWVALEINIFSFFQMGIIIIGDSSGAKALVDIHSHIRRIQRFFSSRKSSVSIELSHNFRNCYCQTIVICRHSYKKIFTTHILENMHDCEFICWVTLKRPQEGYKLNGKLESDHKQTVE